MRPRVSHRGGRSFTLLELIVVMAMLAAIVTLSAPRLSGFIEGRHVEEECRRFLALTQFAREEAISRGEQVELWVNRETGQYGVRLLTSADDEGEKPLPLFTCQENLGLTVESDAIDEGEQEFSILFWPDGLVDETSPAGVIVLEGGEPVYEIRLEENHLRFVLERYDGES